ncbi:hypothetical protein V495_06710 [Pseudogymnoascus sp. VKM F-4514 (FW-929)]|nr:hypothetical protein V495_06710 [Pseudogymnoascus sp. VKM F-4514 (FW-929)]
MSTQALLAASGPPIYQLDVQAAFLACSDREKLYIHHMTKACYHGTRVILQQVSLESETIFDLLMELAKSCEGNFSQLQANANIDSKDLDDLLDFAAAFLDSIGNYRGNGDSKIIPRISATKFEQCCQISEKSMALFELAKERLFSLEPSSLGFPDQNGASGYFLGSSTPTQREIESIQNFLLAEGHLLQNSRFEKDLVDGAAVYTIRVASVLTDALGGIKQTYTLLNPERRINFIYGDHSSPLKILIQHLQEAIKYARNEEQESYLQATIQHFLTGDVQMHKNASIAWLQDKHPHIETLIGFIESYRDPTSIRSEFEALVAIQNSEVTRKLKALAACGADAYKDIKTKYGRKNIFFANRSAAVHMHDQTPFIASEDQDKYRRYKDITFRIIVGIHELIGHGCGKLLGEIRPGAFNFNENDPPINPLTGKAVDTWYRVGETPKSLFGGIATSYSECFAELIALYLIPEPDLLNAMEVMESGVPEDEVVFNAYLQMISMGLRGMASYDPTKKKWGQPHDQARFAIVKYLCTITDETGRNVLRVEIKENPDLDELDLLIQLDKELLGSVARPAIGKICLELHIRRCIADVQGGKSLYQEMTSLDNEHMKWREAVLKHQQARPLFLMSNTTLEDGKVCLKSYPATSAGFVQSWYERCV